MREREIRGIYAPAGLFLTVILALIAAGCGGAGQEGDRSDTAGASAEFPVVAGVKTAQVRSDVVSRLAKFAPTPIEADLSTLSDSQRQVLDKLIEASRLMGETFQRQAWAANPELRRHLMGASDKHSQATLAYFDIHVGPWDRLDDEPFVGDLARPEGAGYYPADLSKAEFEGWLEQNPADEEAFKSLNSVIIREGSGLKAVPYSEAYRSWLEPAAARLQEAAALTENASLRNFLEGRADAFLSDDYYESDVAWMDLDSRIEITIGPYETYEDRLFGYKAAFESFLTLQDEEASAKLAFYKNELPAMERNLPIPDEYKNLNRGTESPIRVVDVVYTAGDARAGVQTIAYNLPNDEGIRETKGSKKVLLRNVMDAKFRSILQPISEAVIAEDQLADVTADAFFNETLFHELSHGLGPGKIKVDGRDTEVRLELKELNSPLEEAKADVMGAWNILYMIDKGAFPGSFKSDLFVTYLAGMFRSVRFGIEEAHGKGVALQYNFLKERGAILQDQATGRFSVDLVKFEAALEELVREICLVQAHGDYQGAAEMLETYARVPPEWQAGLDRINDIPVDIRPIYTAAGERG
jgi:hypothetical protein